jgi:hypothetical protein
VHFVGGKLINLVPRAIYVMCEELPWQLQGVPEKEQKQTKTSGHFPDLKIFSSTNVLMIQDSV